MEHTPCGKCRVIIMHDPDGTGIEPCKLHSAAPTLLEALKELTPLAQRFFQDYAPDATTDFTCGHAIRQARDAIEATK